MRFDPQEEAVRRAILKKYGALGFCKHLGRMVPNSLSNIVGCDGCPHLRIKETWRTVLHRRAKK